MKHIKCVQNTEAWYMARLGKPTSSEFDKVVKKTGGFSTQRFEYMYKLIYERIYQKPLNTFAPNYWMQRGKILEPIAAEACERYIGKPLRAVGLVTNNDGRLACSPDRIVDWHHAVEIKCPKPWRHLEYSVLGPQSDYFMQIYGIMYVGEFDRVSFFSFCPGMPCVVHEIKRDEKIMRVLDKMLPLFADEVDKHEEAARKLGPYEFVEFTMEQAMPWELEANY